MEEEDDSDWEDGDAMDLEECLFCSEAAESLSANLQHMSLKHGFFLPDVQYCTSIEGMIRYLGNQGEARLGGGPYGGGGGIGKVGVFLWMGQVGQNHNQCYAVQAIEVCKTS